MGMMKQGVALENSTSTSQQDLQNYSQQQQQQQPAPQQPPSISHNPAGHYIYQQQPHSPVPPQSPGSPLSYSNNPSAPPSPTGHPGPPTLTSDGIDQNSYVINQAQAAALQQDFEQFTMFTGGLKTNGVYLLPAFVQDWPKFAQQLMELGCTWTTQIENDMINVGGDLGSGDGGYYSTSPQVGYQPTNTSTTTAQQLTPQTPNTPTIILTDFSGADDLTNPEFVKDLGTAMMSDFDPELFPTDDALRQGLGQIDVDGLQMLTDPTVVISDPSAEAHFRLDRL
ncbi:hypothetical protein M0802_007581 [Mischocyttarus mexicanus]|nr:hypothetical protein M0802_007581 [Mischocyttarus mexicanus]